MQTRRESNTEATIAAILQAARTRFGTQGFEGASLEEIGADARVTTGAIYHHFGNKAGLFRAVAEQIEAELLACSLSVDDPDVWQQTIGAFTRLIEACAAPEVQRIIFLDAKRVLGPAAWREIEMKYGYGAMATALAALMQAGIIRNYPIEVVAPILLALLAEASRARAARADLGDAAAEIVTMVLESLKVVTSPAT